MPQNEIRTDIGLSNEMTAHFLQMQLFREKPLIHNSEDRLAYWDALIEQVHKIATRVFANSIITKEEWVTQENADLFFVWGIEYLAPYKETCDNTKAKICIKLLACLDAIPVPAFRN